MIENSLRPGMSESNRTEVVLENGPTVEMDASRRFTAEDAAKTMAFGTFQVKLILLSGTIWMTRGFEFVLSNHIGPLLSCYWILPSWKIELLTGVSSACTVFGCIICGMWSDKFGRRMALSSSLIFLFVSGAVSAGLPSYTWYIIFRWVSAFAVGGLAQVLTLLCEYMPGKQRGRAVFVLSCFWAIGIIMMTTILYATLNRAEGWRLFVGLSAFPAFLSMILMRWFPESFRFLLVNNQHIAAQNTLEEMAADNQQHLPDGQLGPIKHCPKKGRISKLLNRFHLRTTLLLCYMGLAAAVTVTGLDILTPFIAQGRLKSENTITWFLNASEKNDTSKEPCFNSMSQNEFIEILWTSSLDFPGFVIFILLVDYIDRKKLLCASFLIVSLFVFLLLIPTEKLGLDIMLGRLGILDAILTPILQVYCRLTQNRITCVTAHVGFLFCAKTLIVSQFELLLLAAAEDANITLHSVVLNTSRSFTMLAKKNKREQTYPTTERGVAIGVEVATFNAGFLAGFYIIQVLSQLGTYYIYSLLGCLPFSCAVAAVLLPWETRGMELLDFCKI